jgi:hypothetical protein
MMIDKRLTFPRLPSFPGSIGSGPSPTQITMFDATATYPLDSVSGLFGRGSSFRARWLNSY